jgi:outer membrane protein OmpA-like peptidoglycan-associated protein
MKPVIYLIISLISTQLFAQKAEKLRVGEKIPFSRVVVLDEKKNKSNLDLPNGKNTTDRFVLVYFYSSETPVKDLVAINNSIERILNKYQNNACKGASEIEYATVCLEKDYRKWQNLLNETNYNKSKFSGKKNNYLAEEGLKDKAVTVFKITKTPSMFLVNPKGRLFVETDSIEVLEKTFQNICRVNSSYSTADVSGKLLIENKSKVPLTQHQVYLVKENVDTIKTTTTDNFGDFTFKQVDTTQKLSIRIEQNQKTKGGPRVYLAKQNGEVISEFKKNSSGNFEYKLLAVDVEKLSAIDDEDIDDITMKYKKFNSSSKKDLIVTENIYYESSKFNILTEGEIVLDKVLSILNSFPDIQLEVISHTDSQGDDNSNFTLSENRSNSVVNYLVSKGIPNSRLKAIGKGETEIRNRCFNGVTCSDREHEYNRRTEFKFIRK